MRLVQTSPPDDALWAFDAMCNIRTFVFIFHFIAMMCLPLFFFQAADFSLQQTCEKVALMISNYR